MKIGVVVPSWDATKAASVIYNLKKYDTGDYLKSASISGANRAHNRWGPVQAMAKGIEKIKDCDIYVFCHDDIEVYEDWTGIILTIFQVRPEAGLVGFHGAKGLGSDDIYRTRYQLNQLARYNPMSNMVNAEEHGKRVTLPCEVATVDGFFMAVRAEAYHKIGGWEACLRDNIVFHMYDSWMAMALREHGYLTYLAPVDCDHKGGGTEVGKAKEYEIWAKENGFDGVSDVHTKGHLAFYERFRGQLPIRVR